MIPLGLIVLAIVICYDTLWYYGKFQLSVMGFLLLPFVLQIEKTASKSFRYGLGLLFLFFFYLLIPSKLLLLFAFYAFLFFVIESQIGRVHLLAPILVVASSPLIYYTFELFGFPIRFQLTKIAVILLQNMGYACQAEGNWIAFNEQLFSVDPVCMGLNMALTSILAAIILMRFYSWQTGQVWSIVGIGFVLITTLGLVIVGNLIRILLLILTGIEAEHPLHEGIGLMVMVLLVLLPLYGFFQYLKLRNLKFISFIPFFIKNKPLHSVKTKKLQANSLKFVMSYYLISIIFLIALFFTHWTHPQLTIEKLDHITTSLNLDGYEKDIFNFKNRIEVLRFTSERAIIYIKNQDPFRLTNHNPLICWRGSGYEFKAEKLLEVGTKQVYIATLHKDHQILYTAWWLDNGNHQTTSSFDWRWQAFQTKQAYQMVNVTSADFSTLYIEVERLLSK